MTTVSLVESHFDIKNVRLSKNRDRETASGSV